MLTTQFYVRGRSPKADPRTAIQTLEVNRLQIRCIEKEGNSSKAALKETFLYVNPHAMATLQLGACNGEDATLAFLPTILV